MELVTVWNGDISSQSRGHLICQPDVPRPAPPLPTSVGGRPYKELVRLSHSERAIAARLRQGPATKRQLAVAAGCGLWSVVMVLKRLNLSGTDVRRDYQAGHLGKAAVYWIPSEAA